VIAEGLRHPTLINNLRVARAYITGDDDPSTWQPAVSHGLTQGLLRERLDLPACTACALVVSSLEASIQCRPRDRLVAGRPPADLAAASSAPDRILTFLLFVLTMVAATIWGAPPRSNRTAAP
jgi:hypothetical protein